MIGGRLSPMRPPSPPRPPLRTSTGSTLPTIGPSRPQVRHDSDAPGTQPRSTRSRASSTLGVTFGALPPATIRDAGRHDSLGPSRLSRRETSVGASNTSATFKGRGGFAAYVAHEMRAPISLQRALVEVTLADPDADTAALREMGERVVTSCMWQQRMIDALLDLARSERGLTRHEPVNLAAVTTRALQAHDLSELESVTALEPAWTTGDPYLLERLAANLVSNAIRHNIIGGKIEVTTRAQPERAVLSVANTGRKSRPANSSASSNLSNGSHASPATRRRASGSASPSFRQSPTHTTPRSPRTPTTAVASESMSPFPRLRTRARPSNPHPNRADGM